jgi:TRAP-type C4-dicarboxylate transport system substrate-binding protein
MKRAIFFGLVLFFCIGGIVIPNTYAKQVKYNLKIATLAPKSVGWAKNIVKIIHPAIDRVTDGNVKLKWYWGGVMGDDKDYIQKMKIGQIDGAALTGQGTVLACPEMAVLELPFMFRSFDEVDYVRERMMDRFDAAAEKHGYKIIVWADQDFDQIYSVKYEMNSFDDFRKAKIITWYGTLEQKVLAKLGSSPVPVGVPEVVSSMRQGIADSFIGPAIWLVGSQMYTMVKYVNPLKIRYSPATSFVSVEFWNSLPKEYRQALKGIRSNEVVEFAKACRSDTEKAFDAMVKYGLNVSKMEPEVLKAMEDKTREVWYEMVGKEYDKSLLDELLANLKEFRARGKK